MANIPLTSIGVVVSYSCVTTGSSMPTSGYVKLKGIMSTPDYSIAPNTADVTSFENKEYTSKIQLLKEIPDNLEFGMRFGQEAYDAWEAMVTASTNKDCYLCIDIEGFNKAIYTKGKPASIGIPAMEVNSGIDVTCYFTPLGEPTFASDPTYA